jgi:exoribonuclease-2
VFAAALAYNLAMNVFYEEDGGFKAGVVLADQATTLQVESASGKRSKIKANQVLLRFEMPTPPDLIAQANALAGDIDLDFLWEVAPEDDFGFADLAEEYFGPKPQSVQQAALVTRLHAAPMYFYRRGKGRYKAAPEEALKAALAGVEKRRLQAMLKDEYVAELGQGILPERFAGHVDHLLFRPDKNGIEFKALEEAAHAQGITPARLMLKIKGLASARDLHERRFLFEHFPHGVMPPTYPHQLHIGSLPLATAAAFSIDDHTTTEIDDAFSVERLGDGVRVGIHIAAPAIAIARDDENDRAARERYSTVYMPGSKITMLSDALISSFSLLEGHVLPAVSLYLTLDAAGQIIDRNTVLEQVRIESNLRLNQWDDKVTEESLVASHEAGSIMDRLGVLWGLASKLYVERQAARVAAGLKPEVRNRPDYNFYIDPEGSVEITERRRDAPLDRLVAELMILANSTWGKLLADQGLIGIYRGQQGFGPQGRVRMVAHAMPHQGLGVAQYAWSTSPLRRYVDLFNQWQILAAIGARPVSFEKNDAEVFAIISGFEAAYQAYADHQSLMERFWCLRWVEQRGIDVFDARLQRDDSAVLVDIPLTLRIAPLANLARGTRLEVKVQQIDEVDLTAQTQVMAIIEEVDAEDMPEDDQDESVGDGATATPGTVHT